jgi:hypothetical protein
MLGRDLHKTSVEEVARIRLPVKVNHTLVNETDDPLYNGMKVIQYTDGLRWMHVELMGESEDGYSPIKSQIVGDPLCFVNEVLMKTKTAPINHHLEGI